jgi:hypothetical protein
MPCNVGVSDIHTLCQRGVAQPLNHRENFRLKRRVEFEPEKLGSRWRINLGRRQQLTRCLGSAAGVLGTRAPRRHGGELELAAVKAGAAGAALAGWLAL